MEGKEKLRSVQAVINSLYKNGKIPKMQKFHFHFRAFLSTFTTQSEKKKPDKMFATGTIHRFPFPFSSADTA
jgi:hypothetical protein